MPTRAGGVAMKLLKIDGSQGLFFSRKGEYMPIDQLSRNELLSLVDRTLEEDDIEFDEYDDDAIKNQAHQIIYRSVEAKLRDLRGRRTEFVDASARLFLDAYQKYKNSPPE